MDTPPQGQGTPNNVHGTAIAIEGRGVLIRGASGAGKSLLALDLLDHYTARGKQAELVADDQVMVSRQGDELRLSPPQSIAGMIELRGRGIVHRPFRAHIVLVLLVDLVPDLARLPHSDAFRDELFGVALARCPVPVRGQTDPTHQRLLVTEALHSLRERV